MPRRHRGTTTSAGYGADHQRTRARLLALHVDGTPCPCGADCGVGCPCRRAGRQLPMYREPTWNVDGRALQADHSTPRALARGQADRLMLATCNLSRGAAFGNRRRGAHRPAPPPPAVVLPVW
jgi:hypothetical protein